MSRHKADQTRGESNEGTQQWYPEKEAKHVDRLIAGAAGISSSGTGA